MRKDGFTIIEVVVVFLLILGVTFLILPSSLDSTRQAKFISKWNDKYSELVYMFSVIKAQSDSEIQHKLQGAKNDDDRKNIMLDTVKPYLRITGEEPSNYKQRYMNKTLVLKEDKYYFNNFYLTSSGEIVGLKWVKPDCKGEDVCAVMDFDVNGADSPNAWGRDVFGINVFKDKIEPIGKNTDPDDLKNNCSKRGFGTDCSYYYLIGGKFD